MLNSFKTKPNKNNQTIVATPFERSNSSNSSNISMMEKPSLTTVISFGSAKERYIERKLVTLINRYAHQSNPLILQVKSGFVSQLARKIAIAQDKPLIIGITGQSASGKTEFLNRTQQCVEDCEENYSILSFIKGDNYYKDNVELRHKFGGAANLMASGYSFDAPESMNLTKLSEDLTRLSHGREIMIPSYEFETGASIPDQFHVSPSKIIVLDSIFALNKKVRNALDIGIYVDCNPNELKNRWFERINKRHSDLSFEDANKMYKDVSSKAKEYIIPAKNEADIIISGEAPLEMSTSFGNDILRLILG